MNCDGGNFGVLPLTNFHGQTCANNSARQTQAGPKKLGVMNLYLRVSRSTSSNWVVIVVVVSTDFTIEKKGPTFCTAYVLKMPSIFLNFAWIVIRGKLLNGIDLSV